jgi:ribonuclease J
MILTTGAQGEPNAGLMKMADGEHRWVQIKAGDMVVFSSSVIPGNERNVQNLHDNLARQGAIVFNSKMIDIHASGHAPQDDLKMIMKLVKPQYLIPIHGYYFMRAVNALSAREVGIKNTILVDNGDVVELTSDNVRVSGEKLPAFYVMVDGLGVGDVGEVVLRDRLMLAQEGMVVIIAVLGRKTGRVLKNPDIISRGFIYLKENQELLNDIRHKIKGIIGKIPRTQNLDADYIKLLIRDQIGELLYKKTGRRPMILPVVIEI